MKKYTQQELYLMDCVEVYKLVLNEDLKRFPIGYWEQSNAINNATEIVRYLVEDKYALTEKQLKEQLSAKFFQKNKLGAMLNICFNGSPYKAINSVYKDKYKQWEFNHVPQSYWKDIENAKMAVKWLIEDSLRLSENELKEQLSRSLFVNNGLGGMLQYAFGNSGYKAIDITYPNRYKKSDFKNYKYE